MKKIYILLPLALIVFGAIGIYAYMVQEPPFDIMGSRQEEYNARQQAIYDVAQTFVLDVLKAPASAEFPPIKTEGLFVYTIDMDDGTHSASGYVDAQNSYGALIRSEYSIDMQFYGGEFTDPKNWEYLSFYFNNEEVTP